MLEVQYDPITNSFDRAFWLRDLTEQKENSIDESWRAFQIWKNKDKFSNGLVHLYGQWAESSLNVIRNHARHKAVNNLNDLDQIPSIYFAQVDLSKQTHFCRDVLIPYIFHYRKTPFPPPLYILSTVHPVIYPPTDKRALFLKLSEKTDESDQIKPSNLFGQMIGLHDIVKSTNNSQLSDKNHNVSVFLRLSIVEFR